MPPSVDRLTLMQWLSPAFPVGSYAYSQGLEQAITDGHVHDAASLTDWITAVLTHGSARIDAIQLAPGRTQDLADLAPLILRAATTCATAPLTALTSATIGAALAQMHHETLPVRIYRS